MSDQAAIGIDLAAHIDAVLDDVEPRRFLTLADRGREADGDAIQAVIMAVADAEIARVGDDRRTGASGPGLGGGIGQAIAQCGVGGEIDRLAGAWLG